MTDSEQEFQIYTPLRDIMRISSTKKYIPHRSPVISDFRDWHSAYEPYIIQMYILTQKIIRSRHPKSDMSDSDILFTNFSTIIYHLSSKHIDENLNEPDVYLQN